MTPNTQDFKINNQYSICLDEFFDIESLHNLYPEIIKGVVRSKEFYEPIDIGNQQAIFNKEHIAPTVYIRETFSKTAEYRELKSEGLSDTEIYEYVQYKFPLKSLGTKLLLRTYPEYSKSFSSKHQSDLNVDQPAYAYFSGLKKWLQDADVFSEIGRIIIFVNHLGSYTPTHCDYSNLESQKDQFLWINLFDKKKFFVLDTQWNKHYINGEINIFDNASWHGSEPAKYNCFTIRVDGIFRESFLRKAGLYEHFN